MKTHNPKLKRRIAKYIANIFQTCDDEYLNELVLDRLLWTATEDSDQNERVKYKGQPYWSKNAIEQYQKINYGRREKKFDGLIHEHVVPRKLIKKMILELDEYNEDTIFHILDTYAHAVVITKAEDKKLNDLGLNQVMPESFYNTGNILERYKEADIQIIDVSNKNLKEIDLSEFPD